VSGYAVDLYAALDKNGIAVAIPSSRRMSATIRRGACHLMNPGHRVPATPTPWCNSDPERQGSLSASHDLILSKARLSFEQADFQGAERVAGS
jgi:hypothetical protein